MKHGFCLCCNKTTQFKNAVYTASNIVKYLQDIMKNITCIKNNDYYNVLHSLSNDKQRISFPCGICHEVNQTELDYLENQMNELLCVFILRHPEKNKYIHQILRLLAGNYPMKYRVIEREIRKEKNND